MLKNDPSDKIGKLNIHVINRQKDLKIASKTVKNLVKHFLALEKLCFDEVFIHFVTEKEICRLHLEYFDDPSPTDCVSFPMDDETEEGYRVMGEVFVCPKTALSYGITHEIDPYQETSLYVIHGLLHLIGYDDIDAKKRRQMRSAEAKHLESLKKNGRMLHA